MVDLAPCMCLPRVLCDRVFFLCSATLDALPPAAVRCSLCLCFAARRGRTALHDVCGQAGRILSAPRHGLPFTEACLGCVLRQRFASTRLDLAHREMSTV